MFSVTGAAENISLPASSVQDSTSFQRPSVFFDGDLRNMLRMQYCKTSVDDGHTKRADAFESQAPNSDELGLLKSCSTSSVSLETLHKD